MDKVNEEPVEKPNYDEISAFIQEHANLEKGSDPTEITFQLNREPYRKFMKSKGVSPEVLRQVSMVHNEYMNGSIKASADIMLKADPEVEKVTIRTRMDIGRMDTIMRKSIQTNNPKTGEKGVRFGSSSVVMRTKTKFDQDLLKDCENAIMEKFADK